MKKIKDNILIKQNLGVNNFIAIIKAENYYETSLFYNQLLFVQQSFIVFTFIDFEIKEQNIEAIQTVAICRDFTDAELVLNNKLKEIKK